MKALPIGCLAVLASLATVSSANAVAPYAGLHRNFGNTRITNGKDAVQGAYPYQISLQYISTTTNAYRHFCGASIINSLWLVTAAHCQDSVTTRTVYAFAGKHAVNEEETNQQMRQVSQWFRHADYVGGVAPHDITLIKLDSAFELNDFVAAINLPASNALHSGEATISGWGSTSLNTTTIRPEILQTVTVTIIDTKECYDIIDGIISSTPNLDPDELFNVCTGDADNLRISVCSGDSGGPLAQQDDGSWELVGIVSWGLYPCGYRGGPSVYVRASAYTGWIEEQIASNS